MNIFSKKSIFWIAILTVFICFIFTSCKKFRYYANETINKSGKVLQQNVKGNIEKGAYFWSYESKDGCVGYKDEICNFYNLDDPNEVGDFFHFIEGKKEGRDELTFYLKSTKDDKIYCKIIYYLSVDADKVIKVDKRVVMDERPKELDEYTYDKVELHD